MASFENKIDFSTIENNVEAKYDDMVFIKIIDDQNVNIMVKPILSATDMLMFSDYVVQVCFIGENNQYVPEMRDFAIKSAIVEKYSNINLPTDTEERCLILYKYDIVERILNVINIDQFNNLVESIDKKIANIIGENYNEISTKVDDLYRNMQDAINNISEAFQGISQEDLKSLIGAISNSTFDEQKVVKAVLDNRKDIV